MLYLITVELNQHNLTLSRHFFFFFDRLHPASGTNQLHQAPPEKTARRGADGRSRGRTRESRVRRCSSQLRVPARNLPKSGPAMRAEVTQISALTAVAAHVLCSAGLAAAHALAGRGALVSDPALALRLLMVLSLTTQLPVPV